MTSRRSARRDAEVRPPDGAKLRRIALARQGLIQRNPFGRGRAATLRAIRHLGYVQIDTISVVVRAHHHVLRTRVPNFVPRHIERLLRERQIFEYRLPVAGFRPIEDFRFFMPYTRSFRSKPLPRETRRAMQRVLDRIRAEGPLRSRDFEDTRAAPGKGWWDWKPAKRALERLYYQGDLMIAARESFEKTYDLTERVMPAGVDVRPPTVVEQAAYLIDGTLRAHGFANYGSFAYAGRGASLGAAIKAELARRTAAGALTTFAVNGGERWWIAPETLDATAPRAGNAAQVLSPFDNAVIERQRLQKIFGFDYLIECYVPEPQRRFGYFCLPILHADRLVGRMDCKSHRETRRFEIKALFLEPDVATRRHATAVIDALAPALVDYAQFDGCDTVTVTRSDPPFARTMLARALEGLS